MSLPHRFQALLWDVDVRRLDEERYRNYVIERFLELGDIDEVRWLVERYGWENVRDFVREAGHRLTPRSASLWARVFETEPVRPSRRQELPWPP